VKNEFIHNGNQNFKCKECDRQFVFNPKNKVIGEETKELIDKLLLKNYLWLASLELQVYQKDGYKPTSIRCTHLFQKM